MSGSLFERGESLSSNAFNRLHMVIVLESQRVHTWIDTKRLTDCDALTTTGDVIGTTGIQVHIIDDIVLFRQILFDIILFKVVVVIIANALA